MSNPVELEPESATSAEARAEPQPRWIRPSLILVGLAVLVLVVVLSRG
jgi:hypothetical protein